MVFQIFVMGIVPDTTAEIEDQILGQDVYRTRRTIFLVISAYILFISCQLSANIHMHSRACPVLSHAFDRT
jgi:hypothetical protein